MTTFMEKMIAEARKRRDRVVALHQKGLSFAEIAKVMNISRPAAWRLWNEAVKRGEIHDALAAPREIIRLSEANPDE